MRDRVWKPLVSAIIPTHNRPDLLVRAVKSVATQTYSEIEIIVVDDCASFDVEAKLRADVSVPNWRVIPNTRSRGAAGARNSGFLASSGAFVAFLDDDDEWLSEKIARQVERFQMADENLGLVTGCDYVQHGGERIRRIRKLEGQVFETLCRKHVAGNTSIPLLRRDVFATVGMFDEELLAAQDTDLWLRIGKRYHFATIEEPVAVIHWEASSRITANFIARLQGTYTFLQKHWHDLHAERKYRLIKLIVRLCLAVGRQKLYAVRVRQ